MADVEVKLEDYTVEVINALDSAIEQYLLEASSEIGSQAAQKYQSFHREVKRIVDI